MFRLLAALALAACVNGLPAANLAVKHVARQACTGTIAVLDASLNGTSYGYISPTLVSGRYGTLSSDDSDAATFTMPCGTDALSLVFPSPAPSTAWPYFGAATGIAGPILGTGLSTFVSITPTIETAAGTLPAYGESAWGDSLGETYEVESCIWTITGSDLFLEPNWVNPDGTTPRTVILWDPTSSLLGITGDFDAWMNDYGYEPAIEVVLQAVL